MKPFLVKAIVLHARGQLLIVLHVRIFRYQEILAFLIAQLALSQFLKYVLHVNTLVTLAQILLINALHAI